jgi:hypothetical protein
MCRALDDATDYGKKAGDDTMVEQDSGRDHTLYDRRSLLAGALAAVMAWPVSIFATGGSPKGIRAIMRRSSPLRGHGLVWILREDD